MSLDLKTLHLKTNGAVTQFEVEAERRREVLAASSPAAKAVAGNRPSRLSALARSLTDVRAGRRASAEPRSPSPSADGRA